MFSPLSLRICCLAAMAPALSNEKTVSENNNYHPTQQLVATIPEGRGERKRRGRPRKTSSLTEQHYLLSLSVVAKTGVSLKSVLSDSNSRVGVPKPGDLYKEEKGIEEEQGKSPIECAKMSSSEGSSMTANNHENNINRTHNNSSNSKLVGKGSTKSLGVVKNSSRSSTLLAKPPATAAPSRSSNGTNRLQQIKLPLSPKLEAPVCDNDSSQKPNVEDTHDREENIMTVPNSPVAKDNINAVAIAGTSQSTEPLKPAADAEPVLELVSVCPPAAKKSKELLEVESGTRQKDLETKADCLYKRLRRLQSRQGISHVKGQLAGVVGHQKRHPQSLNRNSSIDIKEAKDLSTSALVNLVQVWQSKKPPQSSSQKTTTNNSQSQQDDCRLLDETVCGELSRVAGHLSTNLHHLQKSLDSDVTESSSGGESGDEADYEYDWGEVTKPAINRRASWKWAKERAQIASRWTWLQAQVSDLEYRIRQQNEIYKQIRQTKGDVELGEPVSSFSINTILKLGNLPKEVEEKLLELQQKNEASPANISSLLSNLDKQSASIAKYLGNVFTPLESNSPVINTPSSGSSIGGGLGSSLKGNTTPNGLLNTSGHSSCSTLTATPGSAAGEQQQHLESSSNDLTPQQVTHVDSGDSHQASARCRPLLTEVYRKRKLLRTSGLHLHSRKAARLSDVRCQCYPPVMPCAMCGGRYNCVQSSGESEAVQVPERIALLDHSYHQVLSFDEDVPLSIHFEGMLKTGAWQRCSSSRSGRTFHLEKRKGQYQIKEKKGCNKRVPPKSATAAVLSRIKNKYEVTRALSSLPQSPDKKRLSVDLRLKKKKAALNAIDGCRKERGRINARSQSDSSLHRRDTPSPNSSHGREYGMREYREVMRRKQTESAYDINNIVIPYSIAASTRVEKLQYKEIITPRWREVTISKHPDEKKLESSESPESESPAKATEPEESVDMTKAKSVMKEDSVEEMDTAKTTNPCSAAESGVTNTGDETVEIEDMTDEVYAIRHHRHEIDEKKKFAVFPPSQRRRSRPSRAESESVAAAESCLAPAPSGAAAVVGSTSVGELPPQHSSSCLLETGGGANYSPPNTPVSVRKSVSEEADETVVNATYYNNSKRSTTPVDYGSRLRTSSVSSNYSISKSTTRYRSLSHSEDRGLHMYSHHRGGGGQWTERQFPLSEEDNSLLYEEKPVDRYSPFRNHHHLRSVHIERGGGGLINSSSSGRLGYYLDDDEEEDGEDQEEAEEDQKQERVVPVRRNVRSASGSSISTVTDEGDDDQNDPEWTVQKVSSSRSKPGLVLKIAKR